MIDHTILDFGEAAPVLDATSSTWGATPVGGSSDNQRQWRQTPRPEILKDKKAIAADKLFAMLVLEKEPLPYLGDTMYWHVLTEMLQNNYPPLEITIESINQPWPKRVLHLTETGQALVSKQVNWWEIGNSDRTCWWHSSDQRSTRLDVG